MTRRFITPLLLFVTLIGCCTPIRSQQTTLTTTSSQATATASTPLIYHASLALMHPLVQDIYAMTLNTDRPIQWADMHYVVLNRTAPFNTTALTQNQINFMMTDFTNTSYSLNYIAFSPSAGQSIAARFTIKPFNADALDTDWHRYASNVLDSTSLTYTNAPTSTLPIQTPTAPAITLNAPLSTAATTYPIESVASGWYYLITVVPTSFLGLSSTSASTLSNPPGPTAVPYAILFQTSRSYSVSSVRSVYETSGLPTVQLATLSPISSTIWQQSPIYLYPNESLTFQLSFSDLVAQQTNQTGWYNFRTNAVPFSVDGPSILPDLSSASAQASANNLNQFLAISERDGVCNMLCPSGTRCLGGRCIDVSTPCQPACPTTKPVSASTPSTITPITSPSQLPSLCIEGHCVSVARACRVNCTNGAQCLFGFCLRPEFNSQPTRPIGSFAPPDGSTITSLPSLTNASMNFPSGDVSSTTLGALSTQIQPTQWSSLDYTAHVTATQTTAVPLPTFPPSGSTTSSSPTASPYTIYFNGSPTILGPQGGLSWVDVHYRINNGTQSDVAMQAISNSSSTIPLAAPSDLLNSIPSALTSNMPSSITGSLPSVSSVLDPTVASTSSTTTPVKLDYVLERVYLKPTDVLSYAFTYSIATGSSSIFNQQQSAQLQPIVNTPWQTFTPASLTATSITTPTTPASTTSSPSAPPSSLSDVFANLPQVPTFAGPSNGVAPDSMTPPITTTPVPTLATPTQLTGSTMTPTATTTPSSTVNYIFPFSVSSAPMNPSSGLAFLQQSNPMTLPSLPSSLTQSITAPTTPTNPFSTTVTPTSGGLCMLPCFSNPFQADPNGVGPSTITPLSSCVSSCTQSLMPAGVNTTSLSSLLSNAFTNITAPPGLPGTMPTSSTTASTTTASASNTTSTVSPSFPSHECLICYESCSQTPTNDLITCSNQCAAPCDSGLRLNINPNPTAARSTPKATPAGRRLLQVVDTSSDSSTTVPTSIPSPTDPIVVSSTGGSATPIPAAPVSTADSPSSPSSTASSDPFLSSAIASPPTATSSTAPSTFTASPALVSSSTGDSTDTSSVTTVSPPPIITASSSSASLTAVASPTSPPSSPAASSSSTGASSSISSAPATSTTTISSASASTAASTDSSTTAITAGAATTSSLVAQGICNLACMEGDQCYYGQCVDLTTTCRTPCASNEMCVDSHCRGFNYGCPVDCANTTTCSYGFCIPTQSALPTGTASSGSTGGDGGFVIVDPVPPSSSSSSSSGSFWSSQSAPVPGQDPPAPSAEYGPTPHDMVQLLQQGTSLFTTFGSLVPGISATPIGTLMTGFNSVVGVLGNLIPARGIDAQTQMQHSSKSFASRSILEAPAPTNGCSETPCTFNGMSCCLDTCILPNGDVDSSCITQCWDYSCTVTTDNSLTTDPKALVRGLKLFSLMQDLSSRTSTTSDVSSIFDAASNLVTSLGSNRRLLQFPPIGGLGGPIVGGGLGGGLPSIGPGATSSSPSSSGFLSTISDLITSGANAIKNATSNSTSSSTTPANPFSTSSSTTTSTPTTTTTTTSTNPFSSTPSLPSLSSNPFASTTTSSSSNPSATNSFSSVPTTSSSSNPFATNPFSSPTTTTTTSSSNSMSSSLDSLTNAFQTFASSFTSPFGGSAPSSTSTATNPFAQVQSASTTSTLSAAPSGPVPLLNALGQSASLFSTTYKSDLATVSSISVLPISPPSSTTSTPSTSSKPSSGVSATAVGSSSTTLDPTPGIVGSNPDSPTTGPGNIQTVQPACTSGLLTDGTNCGYACMSVFTSFNLLSAGNCFSSCIHNPCIAQNIAQLQSAQMKKIIDQNAAQNPPPGRPTSSSTGGGATGPAALGSGPIGPGLGPILAASSSTAAAGPAIGSGPIGPVSTSTSSTGPTAPIVGQPSTISSSTGILSPISPPPITSSTGTATTSSSSPPGGGPLRPLNLAPFQSFPLSFPPSSPGSSSSSSTSSSSTPLSTSTTSSTSSSGYYFPAGCVSCVSDCQSQQSLPLRQCISASPACRANNCLIPAGSD